MPSCHYHDCHTWTHHDAGRKCGTQNGYRKALQTIFATNFASLILITVSILVLKGFLDIAEQWFNSIKILGCLYIAYLGFQILKEVFFSKEDESSSQLKSKSMNGGFKQGLGRYFQS